VIACALSLAFHWVLAPWRLFPDTSRLEMKDPDGELTLPVDLLGQEPPPEEKPRPPEQKQTPSEDDPNGVKSKGDASAPKPKPDAAAPDAEATAGGGISDAGQGDAAGEAGLVASDASAPAGANGPRDPGAMIGIPGLISAGTVNVQLLVNVAVIRQHPVGARMGPLFHAIPQWADFMKGSQAAVDPIRDTEWIFIYGPSLVHTDRDAVFVRYSISDEIVDTAVEAIARRYDKGGAYDAGVPGVKASLGHADNAERVFLRGAPKTLVIVPKDKAQPFARLAKLGINKKVQPGEAMRLIVNDPWKQVSIPGLKFSNSLTQLRLWIVARASDGGADVFLEGDCTDEAAALDVADALTELIKRQNSLIVRAATRGVLNNARVTTDGSQIKSQLSASSDQLEALLQGVGAMLGAQVQEPGGGGR